MAPRRPDLQRRPHPRRPSEKTFGWRFAVALVAPVVTLLGRYRVEGVEHLPDGPVVITPNHYSDIDPVVVGWVVWRAGRVPRFLAKDSLFRIPVLGRILTAMGQIPVDRTGGGRAASPLTAARRLVDRGLAVIVYPEGTLTRDPGLWPMRGKSGAVRMALEGGVPIVPVAHWGAQAILPRWSNRLHPFPRHTVRLRFGPPVDLDAYRGRPVDGPELLEATGVVMQAITRELEALRGESAPAKRWDPVEHGQSEYGRPTEHGVPIEADPQ